MAMTKASVVKAFVNFFEEIDKLYVRKDGAKGLSTNDFTDALKEKLEGITDEEITTADIQNIFSQAAGGGDGE